MGLPCYCNEYYTKSQLDKHFQQIKKKADALRQELEEEAKQLHQVRMKQKERFDSDFDYISSDDENRNEKKQVVMVEAQPIIINPPVDEEEHNVPPVQPPRQIPNNEGQAN